MRVEIVQLLASPITRYVGRPSDGPLPAPPGEIAESVQVRAGLGIVGDRYFGKRAHRDAAVTVMALESLPAGFDLREARRNVLVRGADIDALVGSTFSLDYGDGPVSFVAHRRANPCGWMDVMIGEGARKALRGKGGVRCAVLSDGMLRVGPAQLVVLEPRPAAQ